MNLFKTLIGKPLRWIASSAEGKNGRDAFDKYAPFIEAAALHYAPVLAISGADAATLAVTQLAKEQGIPSALVTGVVDAVIQKIWGKS